MKVPCEKVNIKKLYLSYILYGIQIHKLSKLRIIKTEAKVLYDEDVQDEEFLENFKCLLCYKAPEDKFVYFYYNFPEYYELCKKTNSVQQDKKFKYPYEIKMSFQDENEKVKMLIFTITGFYSCGLITNIIQNNGLVFYRYGTAIDYIMTLEEKEIISKIKE